MMERPGGPSLTHERIWAAIDAFAASHGLTASGLARRAGLDATTFNPSKRVGGDGRPRWPSMESIAKILEATGAPSDRFFVLLGDAEERAARGRTIPIANLAAAAGGDLFDARGVPAGSAWSEIHFPGEGRDLVALAVTDESLTPDYRRGDVMVLRPGAELRRGDKVLLCLAGGRFLVRRLIRRGARSIDVEAASRGRGDPGAAERHAPPDLAWVARILWASQ